MANIRTILDERLKTHGEYSHQAKMTWEVMHIWQEDACSNWDKLSPDKKESLHMILHKIGRILTGDPDQRDHWDDIAGYATLSADRCKAPRTFLVGKVESNRPGTPEDGGQHEIIMKAGGKEYMGNE